MSWTLASGRLNWTYKIAIHERLFVEKMSVVKVQSLELGPSWNRTVADFNRALPVVFDDFKRGLNIRGVVNSTWEQLGCHSLDSDAPLDVVKACRNKMYKSMTPEHVSRRKLLNEACRSKNGASNPLCREARDTKP